jgi:hypothetical protein
LDRVSPAALGCKRHESSAVDIKTGERVPREDSFFNIGRQEGPCIVAAEAERRLREVIVPEGEELRFFGDFMGHYGSVRKLNHRADGIFDALAVLFEYARGHTIDQLTQDLQFTLVVTSGIMISSDSAGPECRATSQGASKIARACIS